MGYLKYKGGINKQSVSNLFESSMNFEPEKSTKMSKTKRHRSTLKSKKNSMRKSRSPHKLNTNDIRQRHQSISYMQQQEVIELERDDSR
jgi:hypothetical protein